jgi:hypothetical protein
VSENPDARQSHPGVHRHPTDPGLDCVYVQDLVAPYVMAALDPEEQRRIDRHRNRCLACDGLIAQTRETVCYLAFAAPIVTPPARAKSALMGRIAQERQAESLFRQPTLAAATAPTVTIPSSRGALAPIPQGWAEGNRTRQQLLPAKTGRGGRFRPNWQLFATPLATVPLILALGIVGVWAMNTQNRLSASSAQVQSLNQEVASLNGRVSALNQTLREVDDFIVAADAKRYDMTASRGDAASKAVGQVIANPGTDEALVWVEGLDDRHSTYEILLESNGGSMVSAGELPVSEDGVGKMVLKLNQPFATYRSVHVKPKADDNSGGSSDSVPPSAPDALSGVIGENLGGAGDTNVPDAGQSS